MNSRTVLLLNLALAFYNIGTIWAREVDIFRSWKLASTVVLHMANGPGDTRSRQSNRQEQVQREERSNMGSCASGPLERVEKPLGRRVRISCFHHAGSEETLRGDSAAQSGARHGGTRSAYLCRATPALPSR